MLSVAWFGFSGAWLDRYGWIDQAVLYIWFGSGSGFEYLSAKIL